jgi:hypothetical protein
MRSAERSPSSAPSSRSRMRLRGPISIVGTPAESGNESLIRRLALDRLRDLHDDGVTMDYIGRMYEVSGERMRAVERELRG